MQVIAGFRISWVSVISNMPRCVKGDSSLADTRRGSIPTSSEPAPQVRDVARQIIRVRMRTPEDKLAEALLKDGGCKRRAAVEEMAKSFAGKVEAFYYAFRNSDVFVIIDGPDNVTAAAASVAVNAVATTAEARSAGTPRLVWEVML